jgi:hypothetical protein
MHQAAASASIDAGKDVSGTAADTAAAVLRASVPLLGMVRLALAAWAGARPGPVAAGVGVQPDQQRNAVPYVYALAARELVLGVGAVRSWRRGHSGAGWVAAMAASDAFDALVYELLAELNVLDARRARRATWFALSGAVPESVTAAALVARSR